MGNQKTKDAPPAAATAATPAPVSSGANTGSGGAPRASAKKEEEKVPEKRKGPTREDRDEEEEDKNDEDVADNPGGDFKASAESNPDGDESYSFWDRNKTFKPEKKLKGQKQQKLQRTIKATMKATLGGGDLRKTVQLPEGEDLNEWIAVNTVHFYNAANMIYGTCAEFCTEETCKTMSAGRNEYLWKDGAGYKKPTRVSAPVYIDLLLNWVNEQISNPDLFPVDENAKFPRNFMTKVKDIYKRLFRLYAHLYYSHFEKIASIGAKAHLNTCFKHFVFFYS